MPSDSSLDKLLKETISEHLVATPSMDFTARTVDAVTASVTVTKPLISGKAFALYGFILAVATVILALTGQAGKFGITNTFRKLIRTLLPDPNAFQFTLNSQVIQITVCACILILFQLTLLKKIILR